MDHQMHGQSDITPQMSPSLSSSLPPSDQGAVKVFQIACLNCRRSHRKCSKMLPQCKECVERSMVCEYPRPKNKRGLTRMLRVNAAAAASAAATDAVVDAVVDASGGSEDAAVALGASAAMAATAVAANVKDGMKIEGAAERRRKRRAGGDGGGGGGTHGDGNGQTKRAKSRSGESPKAQSLSHPSSSSSAAAAAAAGVSHHGASVAAVVPAAAAPSDRRTPPPPPPPVGPPLHISSGLLQLAEQIAAADNDTSVEADSSSSSSGTSGGGSDGSVSASRGHRNRDQSPQRLQQDQGHHQPHLHHHHHHHHHEEHILNPSLPNAQIVLNSKLQHSQLFLNIYFNYTTMGVSPLLSHIKMQELLEIDYQLLQLEQHTGTDGPSLINSLTSMDNSISIASSVLAKPTVIDPFDLAVLYSIEARCLQQIGKAVEAKKIYEKCSAILSDKFFRGHDFEQEEPQSASIFIGAAAAMLMLSIYLLGEGSHRRAKFFIHNAKFIIDDREEFMDNRLQYSHTENSQQLQVIKEYYSMATLLSRMSEEKSYLQKCRIMQMLMDNHFSKNSDTNGDTSNRKGSSSTTPLDISNTSSGSSKNNNPDGDNRNAPSSEPTKSSSSPSSSTDVAPADDIHGIVSRYGLGVNRRSSSPLGVDIKGSQIIARYLEAGSGERRGSTASGSSSLRILSENEKYSTDRFASAVMRLITIHKVMRSQFLQYINSEQFKFKHGEKQFHTLDLSGVILCEGLKLHRLFELRESQTQKRHDGKIEASVAEKNIAILNEVISETANTISLRTCSPFFSMCMSTCVEFVLLAARAHTEMYLNLVEAHHRVVDRDTATENNFLLEKKIMAQWLLMDMKAVRIMEQRYSGLIHMKRENSALIQQVEQIVSTEKLEHDRRSPIAYPIAPFPSTFTGDVSHIPSGSVPLSHYGISHHHHQLPYMQYSAHPQHQHQHQYLLMNKQSSNPTIPPLLHQPAFYGHGQHQPSFRYPQHHPYYQHMRGSELQSMSPSPTMQLSHLTSSNQPPSFEQVFHNTIQAQENEVHDFLLDLNETLFGDTLPSDSNDHIESADPFSQWNM